MISVSQSIGIGPYVEISNWKYQLKYTKVHGFVLDFRNSTGGIMGHHYFKVGIL